MYFEAVKDCPMREGELIYTENDYAIDFLPHQGGGYNLVLAYLNLIFDSRTKCATQVWGYHPHIIKSTLDRNICRLVLVATVVPLVWVYSRLLILRKLFISIRVCS